MGSPWAGVNLIESFFPVQQALQPASVQNYHANQRNYTGVRLVGHGVLEQQHWRLDRPAGGSPHLAKSHLSRPFTLPLDQFRQRNLQVPPFEAEVSGQLDKGASRYDVHIRGGRGGHGKRMYIVW